MLGSPTLIKMYKRLNALIASFNYILTLFAIAVTQSSLVFTVEIFALLLLKVLISFVGGKVTADLENPHFHKNRFKLKEMTKNKLRKLNSKLNADETKTKGGEEEIEEEDDDEEQEYYSSDDE